MKPACGLPGLSPARSSAWLVGASVSLGIAIGLVLVLVILPPSGSSSGVGPQPPGFTFEEAAVRASTLVANETGGPWRLVSAEGVATTAPVTPIPSGTPINACQTLPGPTLWNASRIPLWIGSLNSGVAPFWSLLFVNPTGDVLPILTINASIHEDPVVTPTSACGEALSTLDGGQPLLNASTIAPVFDSPVASAIAWGAAGSSYLEANSQIVEYYVYGPSPVSGLSWSNNVWGVNYFNCGIPGLAGNVNYSFVGVANSSGPPFVETGGESCVNLGGYNMTLGGATYTQAPGGGEFVAMPVSLSLRGYPPDPLGAWGLATWLSSLNLTNATGVSQLLANVSCESVEFGSSSCPPSGDGWYAALTTQQGDWLDVFAQVPIRASEWFLPNVAIYTNDTLVVYLPHSVASESLTLSLISTNAKRPIVGAQAVI